MEPARANLQYSGGFWKDIYSDIYTNLNYSKINKKLCFYILELDSRWRLNIWNCLSAGL